MAIPAANTRLVRFGVFELDLESCELRKAGVKIKLQDQPFQILAMLLHRPGSIVTREELQKKLWPGDTFVDFDVSLNSAVKKLRQALNDDSDNPKFVETLYRRGYRFIAPVQTANGSGQALAADPAELAAPAQVSTLSHSWLKPALVGSAVAFAALFLALWFLRPTLPAPRILSITQVTHDNLPKENLVTDGQRVYFDEIRNDRQVLAQVSAEGGEVAQIPMPFADAAMLDLSPSASELIVQSMDIQNILMSSTFSGPVWMIPLPAGSPRRVGTISGTGASLSSDGKTMVYTAGSDIYLASPDGSNIRKLATVQGTAVFPRFSPDRSRIRFTVVDRNTGSITLWEIPADGAENPRPLLPDMHQPTGECCGNWSADGSYYYFMALHGKGEIWALPDRAGLRYKSSSRPWRVTNGPLSYKSPVPSRDGRKLFVVGEQLRAELQRYDSRGGTFTSFLGGISAGELDFSRNGQFVAYVSYPDGALWRSRADGSDARQLTYPPLVVSLPRWSPDGQRIVFSASTVTHSLLKAFVISADGGAPQELLGDPAREFADGNWAPDGKSLILARSPVWGSANPHDFVLVRYDLQSGQLSELPGSVGLYAVRWSPDGRYLVALTSDQDRMMLLQLDTGKWSELAAGEDIEYPNWSRDSQALFFESTAGGIRCMFRVNVATHRTEQVVSLAGIRRPEVPFGVEWTGLAPDNSPLIMRDVGIREIYALTLDHP